MFKAVPYIYTMGCEKYKEFISQPFDYNQLGTLDNINCQVLFDGWTGKNMGNWVKYFNDDKVVLEFYAGVCYSIKRATTTWQLPIPKTIDEFINDMNRIGVEINWNKFIDEKFEPKDYFHTEEISKYFTHLLIKLKKIEDIT